VRVLPLCLLAGPLALAGCSSRQSTLEPESHAAREVSDLWWVMLAGSVVVFAVVLALVLIAALRARVRPREVPQDDSGFARGLVIGAGALVPLVVVVALFVVTLRTLPATSAPRSDVALRVEVVGRQWFWDVRYPGRRAATANEIHIPVGTSVAVDVTTRDVIHSLWVPRLNRKIDLIPGRTNTVLLRADDPGVYRGQCAEFCGLQHANMGLLVVAQPPAEFRAWLERQSQPARRPTSSAARVGSRVFQESSCSGCHRIRGTGAVADFGPDLTHVAGRTTLAAATIPNNPGSLSAWIEDPQHFKPGNKMPPTPLSGDQLGALVAYLEGLR
jgi:cytochrome c oxidase subunit II